MKPRLICYLSSVLYIREYNLSMSLHIAQKFLFPRQIKKPKKKHAFETTDKIATDRSAEVIAKLFLSVKNPSTVRLYDTTKKNK